MTTTNNTKSFTPALSQITVITSKYEIEYGRHPKGYGCWAFSIGNLDGYRDVTKAWFTPTSCTYREAVKQAKKEAQAKGATIIYVLP